jgi:hypothetical protein
MCGSSLDERHSLVLSMLGILGRRREGAGYVAKTEQDLAASYRVCGRMQSGARSEEEGEGEGEGEGGRERERGERETGSAGVRARDCQQQGRSKTGRPSNPKVFSKSVAFCRLTRTAYYLLGQRRRYSGRVYPI